MAGLRDGVLAAAFTVLMAAVTVQLVLQVAPVPTLKPAIVVVGTPTLLEERGRWTLYFALKNLGGTVDVEGAVLAAGNATYSVHCSPRIAGRDAYILCTAEVEPAQAYTLRLAGEEIRVYPVPLRP